MNEFMIGVQWDSVVFMRPVPQRLTIQQAVSLAAWLTVIADPAGELVKAKVEELLS